MTTSQTTFPNALTPALAAADSAARPMPGFNNHPHNAVSSAPAQPGVTNYTGMQPAANVTQGHSHGGGGWRPPLCKHNGPHWLVNGGRTVIVADKIANLETRNDLALLIDCSDADPKHYSSPALVLPEGYEALAEFYRPVPCIQIPWPDYGTPRLPAAFWQALADKLPDGKVGVGCVGGHGRTGSALVALRMALFNEAFLDALTITRKDYCASAVETMGQRVYLRDLGIAMGTTPEGSSDGPPVPLHAAHTPTIGEEIAAARSQGANISGSGKSYADWRDERDDGFASVDVFMDADDGGRESFPSKNARKKWLKRQKREAARLKQRAARDAAELSPEALREANDATLARMGAAAAETIHRGNASPAALLKAAALTGATSYSARLRQDDAAAEYQDEQERRRDADAEAREDRAYGYLKAGME